MPTQILLLWTYLKARVESAGGWSDRGTAVETVILTAVFAALAIGVGAIIVIKVTAKANSISLN